MKLLIANEELRSKLRGSSCIGNYYTCFVAHTSRLAVGYEPQMHSNQYQYVKISCLYSLTENSKYLSALSLKPAV
jgi:hypothetical protein